MTRKESNLQILKELTEYFEKYPESRFGQALINLGFTDDRIDLELGKHYNDLPYNAEGAHYLAKLRMAKEAQEQINQRAHGEFQ